MPWARLRFRLPPALEQQLLRLSPRQMDRRLAPYRQRVRTGRYGRTKPGTLLQHHIPLRTGRWDVTVPGFTEVDLVAHSGESGEGEFVHSLNQTDIPTTWVETRAVLGRGQAGVVAALAEMRQALPFPLRGIDSDNGSEFSNAHRVRYCQAQGIQFTRGRPYKKDDNAHIEQKNWTHVRKLMGYVRYDSPAARDAMNALYRHELRLLQNLFLPSVKLLRKVRVGARVRRLYDRPQTTLERVLACPAAESEGWPSSRRSGSSSIPSPWRRPLTSSSPASRRWPTTGPGLSRTRRRRPSPPSSARPSRLSPRASASRAPSAPRDALPRGG